MRRIQGVPSKVIHFMQCTLHSMLPSCRSYFRLKNSCTVHTLLAVWLKSKRRTANRSSLLNKTYSELTQSCRISHAHCFRQGLPTNSTAFSYVMYNNRSSRALSISCSLLTLHRYTAAAAAAAAMTQWRSLHRCEGRLGRLFPIKHLHLHSEATFLYHTKAYMSVDLCNITNIQHLFLTNRTRLPMLIGLKPPKGLSEN